jgi:hypothetical protein
MVVHLAPLRGTAPLAGDLFSRTRRRRDKHAALQCGT